MYFTLLYIMYSAFFFFHSLFYSLGAYANYYSVDTT